MFNLESDVTEREEFLTSKDFKGSVDSVELIAINNHPNSDEEIGDRPTAVSDYKRNLALEFGDLLTEPDETPEEQSRRIAKELADKPLPYACRTNRKRRGVDWIERRWDQYAGR